MMKNDKTNKTKKQEIQLAIKQKCFECLGSWEEVENCNDKECPLNKVRPTEGFGEIEEMEKAIWKFCKICTGDSHGGVRGCPSKDCHLHTFRLCKIPKC